MPSRDAPRALVLRLVDAPYRVQRRVTMAAIAVAFGLVALGRAIRPS